MSHKPTPRPSKSRMNLANIVHKFRQNWENDDRLKFVFFAAGIFVSFICVGILKEKIMKGCYGEYFKHGSCPEDQRFQFAVTIVGMQMLCALIFIKALNLMKPEGKDPTHILYYIFASFANAAEMISSIMALRWISYPVEAIFRSAKPIAIMIAGIFVCKRYKFQRYIFVMLLVIGVIVFKLFEVPGSIEKKKKSLNSTDWKQFTGYCLLVFGVIMDGVLGVIQDRIKTLYSPTPRQMMLSMTACISALTVIIVLVNGEIFKVIDFAIRHPSIIWHLTMLSIAGAIGQMFIFTMVVTFGPLTTSITTTVRKFFSIVFSIVIFHNPSTPIQWVGAFLVFLALICDIIFGKRESVLRSGDQGNKADEIETNIIVSGEKPKSNDHETQFISV